MFSPFHLIVAVPGERLLDAQGVMWVQARLADGGGIGILPGHAPLLAETANGLLRYGDDRGEHSLTLQAGVLEVAKGSVTIYTVGLGLVGATPAPVMESDEGDQHRRLAQALLGSEGR